MAIELRTEAALQALIGESESIELEFKGPDDFLSWPQSRQNVKEDLSKEVSAFANTYGGQILIGIRETRELPHRAEVLEGVDPRRPPIETIQRIIEANIHPRLEGIRYHTIQLSGTNAGRVAYVITVPPGRTAHQAQDKLYYGRSEYECVALEDQLIRYKILRERVAEATINVTDITVETSADEYDKRQQQLRRSDRLIPRERREILEAPVRPFDRYSFALSIKNSGILTIHDCLLAVRLEGFPTRGGNERNAGLDEQERKLFRLAEDKSVQTFGGRTIYPTEVKIFPSQEQAFPGATLTIDVPVGSSVDGAVLTWTLYLEDSPSISGSIQLAEF